MPASTPVDLPPPPSHPAATEGEVTRRTPNGGVAQGWRIATRDQVEARRAENRGRLWLVLSYLLCPCHLPVSLALLGAAFGGTALGSFLTTNSWRTGTILGVLYAAALWRGFTHLRRAKAVAGGALDCSDGVCRV